MRLDEICYKYNTKGIVDRTPDNKYSAPDGQNGRQFWHAYHRSGEHAIRILKCLPETYFIQPHGWIGIFVDHNPSGSEDEYEWVTEVNPDHIEHGPNKLEKSVTFAVANGVLKDANLKQIVYAS